MQYVFGMIIQAECFSIPVDIQFLARIKNLSNIALIWCKIQFDLSFNLHKKTHFSKKSGFFSQNLRVN